MTTQLLIQLPRGRGAICVTRKVETERIVGLEGEHQLKLDWLRDRGSEAKRFANSSAALLL